MRIEKHLLKDVNPLNESQYLKGLVFDYQSEDIRVHQKNKKTLDYQPIIHHHIHDF